MATTMTTPSPPQSTRPLPPRPAPDPEWSDKGACHDDPRPNRWVDLPPLRVNSHLNPDYVQAVDRLAVLCGACPVRDACLWEALDYDVKGVFAGTDEYTRADLRDAHDLPAPIPLGFDDPDPAEADAAQRRFTVRRLARRGLSNNAIADETGLSVMTVFRILDEREPDAPRTRRPRKAAG